MQQTNSTMQKIIRTRPQQERDTRKAPTTAGKQWQRTDKRERFSQQ